MATSTDEFLSLLILSIKSNQKKEIERLISMVNLNAKDSFNILIYLLNETHTSGPNPETLKTIYKSLNLSDPVGIMLRSDKIEDEAIDFFIHSFDLSFYDCFVQLVSFPEDELTDYAIEQLDNIFGNQNINIYNLSMEFLTTNYNEIEGDIDLEKIPVGEPTYFTELEQPKLAKFLADKIVEVSDTAPTPDYIVSVRGEDGMPIKYDNFIVPLIYEIEYKMPTGTEAGEMLVKKLISDGYIDEIDREDSIKRIAEEFDNSTAEAIKHQILLPVYTTFLEMDKDIKRSMFYGPVNPFLNDIYSGQSHDNISRMLTSNVYETLLLEDSTVNPEDIEWFTGSCQVCDKKIPYKHHAARMPEVEGGWSGCYCSFEHVRSTLTDLKDKSDILRTFNPDSFKRFLLDYFDKKINEQGIYDRVYI